MSICKLSVVIPTYNRNDKLRATIGALFAQEQVDPADFEIIVVDDGSTDDTRAVVNDLQRDALVALSYHYQENRGPAAARNLGMNRAAGEIILFIGDDIIATPRLVNIHLEQHQAHHAPQVAVLGRTTWAESMPDTPFLCWWEHSRFRYDLLLDGTDEPNFTYFYTCNISAKRAFMSEAGGFDEEFPTAAYEDTEFAYRLAQRGLKIIFVPAALAYHDHLTDWRAALRRMEKIGQSAPLFKRKTGMNGIPRAWKWNGRMPWMNAPTMALLSRLAEWAQNKYYLPPLYATVMMYHFKQGRRKGLT